MQLQIIERVGWKWEIEGHPRPTGHLSECYLVFAAEFGWDVDESARCTCDDWYPE